MSEREFFSELYDSEFDRVRDCALMQLKHQSMIDLLLGTLDRPDHARVLSIGCGDGNLERIAAPRLGEIWGVDIADVGVAQANHLASRLGLTNARFLRADVTSMEAPEGQKFDAIWAIGFLHHIRDEELGGVLENSFRMLAPGGVMISSDPSAKRLVAHLKPLVRRTYHKFHSPDERELAPTKTVELYESTGFQVERVHFHDFFSGPLAWLWPSIPRPLANVVWQADRAIRLIGPLARLSSGFLIVARKPGPN